MSANGKRVRQGEIDPPGAVFIARMKGGPVMRFLWVLLLLPLAACFDAEADLRISEDEIVTADVKMTLGRQLYDMIQLSGRGGAGLCPDGAETTVGPETAVCEFTETRTLDEALAEAEAAKSEDEFLKNVEVERLDKERLRLSVPLDFSQVERPNELDADNPMMPMMLGALAGHSIVLRVHAMEIEETNAVLSEDRTFTELVIPTTEILQSSGNLPERFEVTLKYRSCGLLGLGC